MGHSRVVAVDVQGEAEAVVHGRFDDILKHAWQAVARTHGKCSRIVFSPMKSPAGKTSIASYQQNAHSLTEQTVLQHCNEMQWGHSHEDDVQQDRLQPWHHITGSTFEC